MTETTSDFDWSPEFYEANKNDCQKVLQDSNNRNKVPVLNPSTSHLLKDHQLVRFVGMVQDMFNPEYFLGRYEVINKETKESFVRSGRYRDTAACSDGEYVRFESDKNVNEERQTFYCITVPALNEWVSPASTARSEAPGSSRSGKRPAEDTSEPSQLPSVTPTAASESGPAQESKRKSQEGAKSGSSVSKEQQKNDSSRYNLPIEDEHSMACLVKTYDGDDTPLLKLNDVIEVVGFLSVNPTLAYVAPDEDSMDYEEQVHNPPPSAVPRVHAVCINKVANSLPTAYPMDKDAILQNAESIRKDLHLVLSQVLLGDTLAANYLICHLISSVYMRKDTMTIGQLSLNFTNVPKHDTYTTKLYKIIERIVAKSHMLPFTLDNMNTLALTPKKCYDGDRLTSGLLQLSDHTHLVVDETQLEPGRLDAMGVNNVKALSELISLQTVNYDFRFYQMPFESDIPVLVLSEGKSLLPNNVLVPLQPDCTCETMIDPIFEAAGHFLKDPLLSSIRSYLQVMRHGTYDLTEEIQKKVQDDFVEMRTVDPENTSADGLHALLVLARLLSLSRGERSLSVESWKEALSMEAERKNRISNMQRPSGVEP